ncbi:NUDIX hydrolase [Dysgonomonas macrotermitis]|uniref:NUDIX domain-containing protein n=1 Tax=Dysgonomonas macrotermitis TaxID=1346286 RepID=A0A1M5EGK7_9BACT|nr:NUDIX domain-containing protein [Dysgonomonas macrotermitis]SHF78317.1 NUDIX domain-containing protein [Dysgonomonas macrotermitis]
MPTDKHTSKKSYAGSKVLQIDGDSLQQGVSVDCVIFGFHDGNMKVLLNKFSYYTQWMLPGGFVGKEESIDTAADRVLKNRTGLENVYLKQFHTFGDWKRTKLPENEEMLILRGFENPKDREKHWLMQRFVSIGYYALVEYSKVKIETNEDEEIAWFDLKDIPELYSDHNEILEKALYTLRIRLSISPIGYELLPEKFTMTEMRIIFETILQKKLDRRNFQRKMLAAGLVYKLDEVSKKFGVKDSALFSFDKEKYEKALTDGFLILE